MVEMYRKQSFINRLTMAPGLKIEVYKVKSQTKLC